MSRRDPTHGRSGCGRGGRRWSFVPQGPGVYLVRAGDGPIKLGYSSNLRTRITELEIALRSLLGRQALPPSWFPLSVIELASFGSFPTAQRELQHREREIHARLQEASFSGATLLPCPTEWYRPGAAWALRQAVADLRDADS